MHGKAASSFSNLQQLQKPTVVGKGGGSGVRSGCLNQKLTNSNAFNGLGAGFALTASTNFEFNRAQGAEATG